MERKEREPPGKSRFRSLTSHKPKGRLKLCLLSLVSIALLASPVLADDETVTETIVIEAPKDLGVRDIENMTDEEYATIPLQDADLTKRRAELLNRYKPGGAGFPLKVQIDSIWPPGGPTTGTTRVTVYGGPFKDMWLIHPKPMCKFGKDSMMVTATYVSCPSAPVGPEDKEAKKAEKVSFKFYY